MSERLKFEILGSTAHEVSLPAIFNQIGFLGFSNPTLVCPFDIFATELTVFITTLCPCGVCMINKNI